MRVGGSLSKLERKVATRTRELGGQFAPAGRTAGVKQLNRKLSENNR